MLHAAGIFEVLELNSAGPGGFKALGYRVSGLRGLGFRGSRV